MPPDDPLTSSSVSPGLFLSLLFFLRFLPFSIDFSPQYLSCLYPQRHIGTVVPQKITFETFAPLAAQPAYTVAYAKRLLLTSHQRRASFEILEATRLLASCGYFLSIFGLF